MILQHSPADIVQRQLDAYNRRDIDAFIALFADDATTLDLGAGSPSFAGHEQIRARYSALFANSPALYSQLINRTAFGRVVVDLERITGREGSTEVFEVLAIYEVVDERIQRVHFVRNS